MITPNTAGNIYRVGLVNYYGYGSDTSYETNNFAYLPSLLRIGGVFGTGTNIPNFAIFFDEGIEYGSNS